MLGVARGVRRTVARPHVLPAEVGTLVAAGVGFPAVHLVADLPQQDRRRIGVAVIGAEPGPLPHGPPVDPVAVDADDGAVADRAVEERHRGGSALCRLVDRDGPHPRQVGGLHEVDEVGGTGAPRPQAPVRVALLARGPVVRVAPAPAGHAEHGDARCDGAVLERRVGEPLAAEPRRHVRAEHAPVDRASDGRQIDHDVRVEPIGGVGRRVRIGSTGSGRRRRVRPIVRRSIRRGGRHRDR